ncbi:MAG TPA: hypothetical protein VFN55_02395 [Solirubrobacteraceae bacterium]|nr:hypothetical protein [Solirubrobacteraceae bacterium]
MSAKTSHGAWSPVRCTHCDQIIGFYEPMIVLSPSGPYEASFVADPELEAARLPRLHRGCAQDSGLIA